ncbi:MAG: class I SAM-dependent methyltransferase [Cyclobacteriaceae bacterium]|nr:class I SAM-dependent methyltransferase [Cyclobacteriaceae bacterium]
MSFYQKIFAKFYDGFMHGFERKLYKKRKHLLSNLEGNVIGVGEGTGINFQFYPDGVNVHSVEPSIPMLDKAKIKAEGKSNITFYNKGINDQSLNTHFKEKSIDAVVCTLVLCTIPDPLQALQNFTRWLKPSGKLIIMEHIHASKQVNKKIQNFINPAWKVFGEGCHLNRNTDDLIKEAGFEPIEEEYFNHTLRFYSGVFQLPQNS